jgi:HSP20 family molecular chaperone IbpA
VRLELSAQSSGVELANARATMTQPIEADPIPKAHSTDRAGEVSAAFKPPLDVIAGDDSILLEMVVPGVHRTDITVERVDRMLVIHGVRRDEHGETGASYHHVETPRGSFVRAIPMPFTLDTDPPVELDRGVLRIRLALPKSEAATRPAGSDDTEAQHNRGESA